MKPGGGGDKDVSACCSCNPPSEMLHCLWTVRQGHAVHGMA